MGILCYNHSSAIKIPRQLYDGYAQVHNWREVRCELCRTLLLKRTKAWTVRCADLKETAQKQGFSKRFVKESITRSQASDVRKSLKPQENVNLIKRFKSEVLSRKIEDFFLWSLHRLY